MSSFAFGSLFRLFLLLFSFSFCFIPIRNLTVNPNNRFIGPSPRPFAFFSHPLNRKKAAFRIESGLLLSYQTSSRGKAQAGQGNGNIPRQTPKKGVKTTRYIRKDSFAQSASTFSCGYRSSARQLKGMTFNFSWMIRNKITRRVFLIAGNLGYLRTVTAYVVAAVWS